MTIKIKIKRARISLMQTNFLFFRADLLLLVFVFFILFTHAIGQNSTPNHENKISLFDYIYNLEETPKIIINSDIKRLINKSRKEKYQESGLTLFDHTGNSLFNVTGRVRARGNMRKQVCRIPPVKFDFAKPLLDSLGFVKNDKLKFVFPCSGSSSAQEKLYKEFFLYDVYGLIDSNGMRVKLVDISLIQGDQEKNQFVGFIIEDEQEYAHRTSAKVVEQGIIKAAALSREHFMKMTFFQYMIANTDWAIRQKHNIEFVKLPGIQRVVAIPYDFDYSGFVGQSYAIPHESLPIKTVQERYFHPYKVSQQEFEKAVEYYQAIEEDVYAICEKATYMRENTIKDNKHFFRKFFDLVRKPKRIKSQIVRK